MANSTGEFNVIRASFLVFMGAHSQCSPLRYATRSLRSRFEEEETIKCPAFLALTQRVTTNLIGKVRGTLIARLRAQNYDLVSCAVAAFHNCEPRYPLLRTLVITFVVVGLYSDMSIPYRLRKSIFLL